MFTLFYMKKVKLQDTENMTKIYSEQTRTL